MSRFAYLVTVWTGERLIETVSSIPQQDGNGDLNTRLLIVDNSQHAWSLSAGWNYGVQRLLYTEGYDAVVVTQDDVILKPDTGRNLVEGLLWRQFAEETHLPDRRELLLLSGYNTKHHQDEGVRFGSGPDYSCFAIGRRYWEEIGPFDEGFNPAFFEDNDSHRRVRVAGYEAGSYAPYFHHGSQTLRGNGQLSDERRAVLDGPGGAFERCRERYVRKWGGMPDAETYALPWNGGSEQAPIPVNGAHDPRQPVKVAG